MIDKDKKKGSVLLQSIISPIVNIAVRPNSNTIAICCENGSLYQWDFQIKPQQIEVLKEFGPEKSVRYLHTELCRTRSGYRTTPLPYERTSREIEKMTPYRSPSVPV